MCKFIVGNKKKYDCKLCVTSRKTVHSFNNKKNLIKVQLECLEVNFTILLKFNLISPHYLISTILKIKPEINVLAFVFVIFLVQKTITKSRTKLAHGVFNVIDFFLPFLDLVAI